MPDVINEVQEIQLRLIELVEYNELDGKSVANDLRSNPTLWRAAILDSESVVKPSRSDYVVAINLIKLRDLPEGIWNVDTLFLLPETGREKQLEALARQWNADEIGWYGGEEAAERLGGGGAIDPHAILRVWWD